LGARDAPAVTVKEVTFVFVVAELKRVPLKLAAVEANTSNPLPTAGNHDSVIDDW
jgi:hypothetical protein